VASDDVAQSVFAMDAREGNLRARNIRLTRCRSNSAQGQALTTAQAPGTGLTCVEFKHRTGTEMAGDPTWRQAPDRENSPIVCNEQNIERLPQADAMYRPARVQPATTDT